MSIEVESTTDSKETVDAVNEAEVKADGGSVSDDTEEIEELSESDTEEQDGESDDTEEDDADDGDTEEDDGEEAETDEDGEGDGEEAEEDDAAQAKDGRKNRQKGLKKRFGKLVSRLNEKDQRILELEQALAAKQKPQDQEQTQSQQAPSATGEPEPDDFETLEEYTKALTKWNFEQFKKEQEQTQQVSAAQAQAQATYQEHAKRAQAYAKENEDFLPMIDDLGAAGFEPSIALQELIFTSEVGPQVFYELAKDPEKLERINSMSFGAAAKEIGKIESRIEAKQAKKPSKKVKKSKAPKPLKPAGRSSSKSIGKSTDEEGLDFAEYERRREAELARRKRA